MRRQAKAPSAGSIKRQASRLGRTFHGGFATREASLRVDGSSAPSSARERKGLLTPLLALLALLAFAPFASAAPTGVVNEFGGPGAGSADGQTDDPWDMAIDQSNGNTYVVDNGNDRVQVFDQGGGFLFKFGSTGSDKAQFQDPRGIAIDQSANVLYVTDEDNRRVQKFDLDGKFIRMWGWGVQNGAASFQICSAALLSCQAGSSGSGDGQFLSTFAGQVAVAPDGSPHDGDVYVADSANERIQVFDPSGNFVTKFGSNGTGDGQFASNWPKHVAIDSLGNIYASDGTSASQSRVQKFDSTHAFTGTIAGLLAATTTGNDGLAVNPANDHLFVLRDPSSGDSVVQEFDQTGVQVPDSPHGVGEGFNTNQGIAVNSASGEIYVGRPESNTLDVVSVLGEGAPPTASLQATVVSGTSATLKGTINPQDGYTRYQFQYRVCPGGVCPGSGAFTSVPAVPQSIGNDHFDVFVTQGLTGLLPGTTYEVQLWADGFGAPTIVGADATGDFSIAPVAPSVSNRPAAPVTATGAVLQAEINPQNAATSYRFEYVDDATFDASGYTTAAKVPVPDGLLGAGVSPIVVFEQVDGLTPQTTYHFRPVANNGTGGDQFGLDLTFTTAAPPVPSGEEGACPNEALRTGASANLPDCRAYELVTPPDKATGAGIGFNSNNSKADGEAAAGGAVGLQALASRNGERFIATSTFGAIMDGNGATAFSSDPTLNERTPDGWLHRSSYNRKDYGVASFIATMGMVAANEDLSTMYYKRKFGIIGSDNGGVLFPEMLGQSLEWPRYLRDWNGNWRFIDGVVGNVDGLTALDVAISADGRYAAFNQPPGARPAFDDEDPARSQSAGDAATLVDVSDGISDTWEERGISARLGVCTGSGTTRTRIPVVDGSGKLTSEACPPALPGDEAALIDRRGSSTVSEANEPSYRRNRISADGSRAFFMSPDPRAAQSTCTPASGTDVCPSQLYVRQVNPDGTVVTRWLSQPRIAGQEASLLGPSYFAGASDTGNRVFFITTSPLTVDDPNGAGIAPPASGVQTGTASSQSWDLYEYQLPSDAQGEPSGVDPADGELRRISRGPSGGADCNTTGNQDISPLRFVSGDGSRLYFTCAAPLGSVPAPQNGTITAPSGTPGTTATANLYLYDSTRSFGQRWSFVAQLPRSTTGGLTQGCATTGPDASSVARKLSGAGSGSNPVSRTITERANCVKGTTDGAFISFWTPGRLIASDPASPTTADIYAYDADADDLTRVTAPQGGLGGTYECGQLHATGTFPMECGGDFGYAGGGSLGFGYVRGVATRPADPGDRIVFFQSRNKLVAEDTDTYMDTYQWKNGALSLVSRNVDDRPVMYAGNSETGEAAFLMTSAVLSWQDIDGAYDIYAAWVGGGVAEPVPAVACEVLGGSCQGAAPQGVAAAAVPATVAVSSGNVRAHKPKPAKKCAKRRVRKAGKCVRKAKGHKKCAKRKVRKAGKCTRKAKKQKRGKHKRMASTNRRAGR